MGRKLFCEKLTITEHHHHDGLDLFPDFGRQIPFEKGKKTATTLLAISTAQGGGLVNK